MYRFTTASVLKFSPVSPSAFCSIKVCHQRRSTSKMESLITATQTRKTTELILDVLNSHNTRRVTGEVDISMRPSPKVALKDFKAFTEVKRIAENCPAWPSARHISLETNALMPHKTTQNSEKSSYCTSVSSSNNTDRTINSHQLKIPRRRRDPDPQCGSQLGLPGGFPSHLDRKHFPRPIGPIIVYGNSMEERNRSKNIFDIETPNNCNPSKPRGGNAPTPLNKPAIRSILKPSRTQAAARPNGGSASFDDAHPKQGDPTGTARTPRRGTLARLLGCLFGTRAATGPGGDEPRAR